MSPQKSPRLRFTRLQAAVHLAALVPLVVLLFDFFTDNLTVNWIQAATQRTGRIAVTVLLISLAVTPLHTLSGYNPLLRLRRPLGLYAFFYAVLHFLMYTVVDYGLNWALLLESLLEKRFIIAGAAAFLILAALAVTSVDAAKKALGRNWKRLHRLVYLAGGVVLLHYAWAVKGDFFSLRGSVAQPLLYAGLLLVLLGLRLPPVKKALLRWRQQGGGFSAWFKNMEKAGEP